MTAFSFVAASLCLGQSDAPYTEGPVWTITMVKTKPGMADDYLKNLAQIYKATNDEAKKQGIIMDYKILLGADSTPQDFDILLMQEFKSMAAFDGLRDRGLRVRRPDLTIATTDHSIPTTDRTLPIVDPIAARQLGILPWTCVPVPRASSAALHE